MLGSPQSVETTQETANEQPQVTEKPELVDQPELAARPPLSLPAQICLRLAAADIADFLGKRGHEAKALDPNALFQVLTDDRLAEVVTSVDFDGQKAIAEQIGVRPRNAIEQRFYCRGQVAAALGLNDGKLLTGEQESQFVAKRSPMYELVAAGVVEPTANDNGVVVHLRRGIDLCLHAN